MSPQRIQLRRTKGWRKPEGAVVVSRPSRWGNPFPMVEFGRSLSLTLFQDVMRGFWNPSHLYHLTDDEYRTVAMRRDNFRNRLVIHPLEAARTELRGRDLACWCSLDVECHGDILLRLANS